MPLTGPALPSPGHAGPVGEWFVPIAMIVVALLIDATALGNASLRDRFATLMTYTGTLGVISVYTLDKSIQGMVGNSWSWRVTWSLIAFVVHCCLIILMIGPWISHIQPQATWLSDFVGMGHAKSASRASRASAAAGTSSTVTTSSGPGPSGAVGKINTKLHLWAIFAAGTYVLARGDASNLPKIIGTWLSSVLGALVMWLVHRLGG